jgi:predicted ribosomally synthesized peptide with nif11-like leader
VSEELKVKEELKLFVNKVAADEELQKKMMSAKTPEEAYAVASSIQEGFSYDEFVDTMTKLKTVIDEQEVTDEDLAKAAGGFSQSDGPVVSITVSGALAASYALGVL